MITVCLHNPFPAAMHLLPPTAARRHDVRGALVALIIGIVVRLLMRSREFGSLATGTRRIPPLLRAFGGPARIHAIAVGKAACRVLWTTLIS